MMLTPLVHERDRSPTGSKRSPKAARELATSSPSRSKSLIRLASDSDVRALIEPPVDGQHVDPEPPEKAWQHKGFRAAGAVDDDLAARPRATQPGVDALAQILHVGVEGAGRGVQFGDLAREGPAELLPV